MERRLTAILAADVVGYSRLMGEDEAATLKAVKKHRSELIDPKAAQYGGRTIKLMGDGVLIDGDDILGNGVNIAARLEGLAEPGGVCIARNVHDQVRDKVDLNFQDLGEVTVKNIARPVPAFQVVMDEKAAALCTPIVQSAVRRIRSSRTVVAAAIAILLLAVTAGLWIRSNSLDFAPAVAANMAFSLPDKSSIAVLPFEALSDDKKSGYFTSGLTEGLTAALARVPVLFVISGRSVATYKGKPVNLKQVAVSPVPSIAATETVVRALKRITARRFRHLIVIRDGVACGVVSIGDLIKAHTREISFENAVLRDKSSLHLIAKS